MKLDIVMLVPGMPFGADTLETKSLGGSESAGVYMARALADRGHNISVFCNTPHLHSDERGVNFFPAQHWAAYAKTTPHDVSIIQRAPEQFATTLNSRLNVLWCHDLALGRASKQFRGSMWNIDKVITLSDFMTKQYKDVMQLSDSAILQSRNGVDIDLINKLRSQHVGGRDKNKIMYCARPERGLDILLEKIFPKLLAQNPDLKLYLATYDNQVDQMAPFYYKIDRLIASFGDSVVQLGSLTKEELYKEYLDAACYVYPTPSPEAPTFSEVSCITAMECQACGVPIVTFDNGALAETIDGRAGVILEGSPTCEMNIEYFVDSVLSICHDDVLRDIYSESGIKHAQDLGWNEVAAEWEAEFIHAIVIMNDNKARLARHLIRNSDIMAAFDLVATWTPTAEEKADYDDVVRMLEDYKFAIEPDGFRKQYERIGETHNPDVINWSPNEPRFHALHNWLDARKDIVKNVLDYGCAHGGYATNLAAQLPHLNIHGIDIDKNSVAMAEQFAGTLGVSDRTKFFTANFTDLSVITDKYDCALAQEVLEHVAEPWEVVDAIEEKVKDDGIVYITVPFGPWEYSSYYNYPWRCHIWHFDMHDLRDMFGDKKDFSVQALGGGVSPELGTPLGWWIVSYRKTNVPTGTIDMHRKQLFQRPRQTVAVNIMAGPNSEDQLHWVLKPLRDIADQIVIVDCGLSDEAKRIISNYKVDLIPGADPKVEGFEVPRNIGLEACHQDWVFWIDTDEHVINHVNMQKYLRENMFHGYAIRQHHFSVDANFSADMPVRLFRKRPHEGNVMRFWGMIHEHPELEINKGPGPIVVMADVHIAHTGYLIESTRQGRFVRNYPLLQKDRERYPDRVLQKHFIMRDNIQLCRFELNQNGGIVTDEMKRLCKENVELYREHFLGKGIYVGSDSLQYYSEALQLLGEGIDVAFQVNADKTQAKSEPQNYRFASSEDFLKEFNRRAEDELAPYGNEYF